MRTGSSLESVLKRDRLMVVIGLALVVVVAAAYTLTGVGMNMSPLTMTRMAIEMPGMAMQPVQWSPVYAFVVFLMWCVMMVAMMVPSAAPVVLIHAAIGRKQENADRPLAATALFVAGYLTVWTAFSFLPPAMPPPMSQTLLTSLCSNSHPTFSPNGRPSAEASHRPAS